MIFAETSLFAVRITKKHKYTNYVRTETKGLLTALSVLFLS